MSKSNVLNTTLAQDIANAQALVAQNSRTSSSSGSAAYQTAPRFEPRPEPDGFAAAASKTSNFAAGAPIQINTAITLLKTDANSSNAGRYTPTKRRAEECDTVHPHGNHSSKATAIPAASKAKTSSSNLMSGGASSSSSHQTSAYAPTTYVSASSSAASAPARGAEASTSTATAKSAKVHVLSCFVCHGNQNQSGGVCPVGDRVQKCYSKCDGSRCSHHSESACVACKEFYPHHDKEGRRHLRCKRCENANLRFRKRRDFALHRPWYTQKWGKWSHVEITEYKQRYEEHKIAVTAASANGLPYGYSTVGGDDTAAIYEQAILQHREQQKTQQGLLLQQQLQHQQLKVQKPTKQQKQSSKSTTAKQQKQSNSAPKTKYKRTKQAKKEPGIAIGSSASASSAAGSSSAANSILKKSDSVGLVTADFASLGGGADMAMNNTYDYHHNYSVPAHDHVHFAEHTNLGVSLSKPNSMSKMLDERGMLVSGFWTPKGGEGGGGGGGSGGGSRSWAGAAASSPSSPNALYSMLGGSASHQQSSSVAPVPSYGGFTPGGAMARLAGQDLGIGHLMNDGIDDNEISDEHFIVNWLGASASASPALPDHNNTYGASVGDIGGIYAPSHHTYDQYQSHQQPHQHQQQQHNSYLGLQQQQHHAPPPPQGSQSSPRVSTTASMSAVSKLQEDVFGHRDDWNDTPSGN